MSKRKPYRPQGVMKNTTGGAHSCARYAGRIGKRDRGDQWVAVRGEGWVRWSEIARQVDSGYRSFLFRRALNGVFIPDRNSLNQASIEQQLAKKSKR